MEYAAVRGFNYQPSYGSHGLEIWGDAFDVAVFRDEIGRGKRYFPGINTIRLWLSFDAYVREPEAVARRFHEAVDLADELDVRFIPTLFNGWHSWPDFGGISLEMISYWGADELFDQVFLPYVQQLVEPHADDDRILLWDLCNEPFNSACCERSQQVFFGWLQRVYRACKALGAVAPIAVGSVPSAASIKRLEPISDVLTFHPYFTWNCGMATPEEFECFVDEVVAFGRAVGKPLLATETGWGALDDKKRADVLAVELGTLAKRGIGFTAHLLHHTLVADGHRPKYGPVTKAGYMAFVEKDGSLRPYHGIFNDF